MTSIPPIDTHLKGALYDRLEDGDPVAPLTGPSRRGTVGKRDAARFCGSRRGRRRDRCPGPGTAGGPETDPAGATEHAHPDREETRVDQDPGEDGRRIPATTRSEEHTSELQSRFDLVCRLLLEKKKIDGLVFDDSMIRY